MTYPAACVFHRIDRIEFYLASLLEIVLGRTPVKGFQCLFAVFSPRKKVDIVSGSKFCKTRKPTTDRKWKSALITWYPGKTKKIVTGRKWDLRVHNQTLPQGD